MAKLWPCRVVEMPHNNEKKRGKVGDKPWSERCKNEVFQNSADIDAGRIVAKKDNLLREYKTTRAGVNTTSAAASVRCLFLFCRGCSHADHCLS
jgi:hypothetical protein